MRLISAVAALGILVTGGSVGLAASPTPVSRVTLTIEPQPLRAALQEFARQTGMQILHRDEDVPLEKVMAPRIEGILSTREALDRLLSNSGFSYEFINARTVRLVPPGLAGAGDGHTEISRVRWLRQAPEPGAAVASGSAARSERPVEEVVVTAQRREQRITDVPISISVVSGAELDRSSVQGVTEMLSRVPGATVVEAHQSGTTQISMRGVTASSGIGFGSSPVAYYLDSIPFGFSKSAIAPDPNAYDLERVEVLRGPQGTLYGASALTGVVRVLTHAADLDRLELKGRASASDSSNGSGNYRGDMMANVPIVDGALAARLVVGYQDLSGWIDKPNRENANDARIRNARLRLDARPVENLSVGLLGWVSRTHLRAPSIGDDSGRSRSTREEPVDTDFDAYGMTLGYDFPSFSVTSMTSYLKYLNDGFVDTTIIGLPDRIRTTLEVRTFSEELNVRSTTDSDWRWSFGGIRRSAYDTTASGLGALNLGTSRTDSHSYAAFGEITRAFLNEKFELTGGLRYFEDKQLFRETTLTIPAGSRINADFTFHKVTPRVVLDWHPVEGNTVYASYSEGFRSGFSQGASIVRNAPQIPPADPDSLKNYEIGAKGSALDGRLNFDSAVYYVDWQDVQTPITVLVPPTNAPYAAVINSGSASGLGVDVGMAVQVMQGLTFNLTGSWNDLTVDSDVVSGGIVLFGKGDRLNLSSKLTASAGFDYNFPVGAGLDVRLSASANYASEREYRAIVSGARVRNVGDDMLISRASIAVDRTDRWSVTLFGDNLNNEQGTPARIPFAPVPDWAIRVRPRTVGIQVDFHL